MTRGDLLRELFRPNGLGSSVWFASTSEWALPSQAKVLVSLALEDAERDAGRREQVLRGGTGRGGNSDEWKFSDESDPESD